MSDIDLVILVVHSNNSNLSPACDEEPRERAPVKRAEWVEGVVDGMIGEEEEEQCHPVVQGKPLAPSLAVPLLTALPANLISLSQRFHYLFFTLNLAFFKKDLFLHFFANHPEYFQLFANDL